MNEHQTNELGRLEIERLIKTHADDTYPWRPICNTDIGKEYETVQRQLRDGLKKGSYPLFGRHFGRDEISAALWFVERILSLLKDRQHGWYCMYCGWLNPEEVTNDEHCAKCGAVLPKGGM